MKQMYVITAHGGSYDDAWERAEFVTDDFDKGTAYIEKMNALADQVRNAFVQYGKWTNHYLVDHPRVGPLPYTEIPVPKWKGSDKITPEMRAERKRIEQENNDRRQAANKPMSDHTAALYAAQIAYKATLPEDIQRGMLQGYDDTSWEIEPINWLE
jgi:hypothetical protein